MALAARVQRAVTDAGTAITGVSLGDHGDKATWKVVPSTLQTAAQPAIDGFNPSDPLHEQKELDAGVMSYMDAERMFSALVWAIIDTYSAPATPTKYQNARTKIINAYKTRPWIP